MNRGPNRFSKKELRKRLASLKRGKKLNLGRLNQNGVNGVVPLVNRRKKEGLRVSSNPWEAPGTEQKPRAEEVSTTRILYRDNDQRRTN